MPSKFAKGPWRVEQASRRRPYLLQIKNSHRDPIAIVYTTEADARLMAASLRMLGSLKHLVAIVRLRQDLRESERAKLAAAEKLIAEVTA